ncbi:MAG TPA: ABC transporter permease subunit, partial [Silvibacterium sp.]|nr:ABC transporter permease subunit [Silvibacterium sp.]
MRASLFSFRTFTALLGSVVALTLFAIVGFLAIYSWPAVRLNGFGFLFQNGWNLGRQYGTPITVGGQLILPGAHYGILFLIVGTLLSTAIALLIAVPLGVGSAMFLAEAVPQLARPWISFFVELLAAIPSVVLGLWGYVVVIPFLGRHLFPLMVRTLGFIPFFGGPAGSGYGLLTASLVLTLMIVPIITATVRDAFVSQPIDIREGALALGATRFEALWGVLLP